MSTGKCTFEFEDGTRGEYDVSLATYASLAPNDVGYLSTRGVRLYRKCTGAGLAESKAAVEQLERELHAADPLAREPAKEDR